MLLQYGKHHTNSTALGSDMEYKILVGSGQLWPSYALAQCKSSITELRVWLTALNLVCSSGSVSIAAHVYVVTVAFLLYFRLLYSHNILYLYLLMYLMLEQVCNSQSVAAINPIYYLDFVTQCGDQNTMILLFVQQLGNHCLVNKYMSCNKITTLYISCMEICTSQQLNCDWLHTVLCYTGCICMCAVF